MSFMTNSWKSLNNGWTSEYCGTTGYCDSALLSIRREEDSGDGASDVGETLRPVSILSAPDAEAPAVGKLVKQYFPTQKSAMRAGCVKPFTDLRFLSAPRRVRILCAP